MYDISVHNCHGYILSIIVMDIFDSTYYAFPFTVGNFHTDFLIIYVADVAN